MDETRARGVLTAAGLPADARLLALGENAVFGAGDVVVKVGRDAELLARAERELAVAAWLAESGVPAVRPAEPKPRLVEGHPVTVWHRLLGAPRSTTSSCGGETTPPPGRRSGRVEAGGSLIRGSPGRVEAASTTSGRAGTARRPGFG